MKNFKTSILLGTTFLALSMPSLAQAQGAKIGVNSALKGDVTVQSGEMAAAQAVVSEPIFLDDSVNSAKSSTLQILLLDETTFTVGPSCELVIDKFVYNPNSNSNSMSAKVKNGAFRFMSGNVSRSQNSTVEIDSPIASMGVRGTIVEGAVGAEAVRLTRMAGAFPAGVTPDENASLFILRGPGPNRASGARQGAIDVTSGGVTVSVDRPGYATFVGAAGVQPTPPFPIPDKVHEELSDVLRTTAKRNKSGGEDPDFELLDPLTEMDKPILEFIQGANGEPIIPFDP